MRTELGDLLRRIRLDNQEILKDMAERFSVKPAFLSAVENGKKKMPDKWFGMLKEFYDLDDNKMEELKCAAMLSNKNIALDLESASSANKALAVSFARKFSSLDEETTKKIIKILNQQHKED